MPSDEFGISAGGKDAEARFLALTGAQRAPKAALGDALLDGNLVEIKGATANTLNQVRAVKFIVLVAYFCPDAGAACWYVVPPHQVVALVARKRRGQHTENPFESATLSVRDLEDFRVDDEAQLGALVLASAREGDAYGDLRLAMNRILEQSRSLAEQSRERVSAVLRGHGLE